MTSTSRGKRAAAALSLAALTFTLGTGVANAAPVTPAAPGDVSASVVLGPITPTSPILYAPADPYGLTGPYYTSTQTVGGLRYTLPLPDGATKVQVSADYGNGTTWFDDNWANADYTNGLIIEGQPFSTYSADQKAANEGSVERIRVVNGTVEITAPMMFADGQQSPLTGYRYTDTSGNVVTHNLTITEKAPLNAKSVAAPDVATVAPGQTVRTYFMADDYEGLTQDHYSRDEIRAVAIQDPNTGQFLDLNTPTTITIAGKGTFTYGIDVAKVQAAYPKSFAADGTFVGDRADYIRTGAFVSFTADAAYTGEVPAIAYRFGDNALDGSATTGSTGSGSGTTTQSYDVLFSPTTVSAETPNSVRTDFLTLGTCNVSAFSTPVKKVNADGSSTSTFSATNTYGTDWGASSTQPFAPGQGINVGVSQSADPNYAPALTVVKEASGVLTLSYTSPDGADLMVGQNSCVATPIPRVSNNAASTITITVAGTPVDVPEKPTTPETPETPVVPETPVGDTANEPLPEPSGDTASRPFANIGNTSANFGGPTKTVEAAAVTETGNDNIGLATGGFVAAGLALIGGLVLALRKKVSNGVKAIKVHADK